LQNKCYFENQLQSNQGHSKNRRYTSLVATLYKQTKPKSSKKHWKQWFFD